MNKNGRLYRSLRAFKHAFMSEMDTLQSLQSQKPAINNIVKKELIAKDLLTITENPNTVEDLKSEYCTGCSACFNLCPVKAISMQYDKEGFLVPVIEHEKCINCGLCINKCPSFKPKYENFDKPKCYAAFGNDKIRMKSSSGAIFSLISSYILNNNGYVCGAAYDENFVLKHMIVSSENDMQKLRESKYVQSDTNTVYTEIGKLLQNNSLVLFSGCGCQTAGLNTYLEAKKIDTDNLYTIDLMCHGSPSPKLFEKYIKEVHAGHEIQSISFRSKEYFGWSTEMNIKYKDGGIYRKTRTIDPYYKAFLPCISVRKSCGHCPFAKLPRQGDLTLADFWGVSSLNANYDDGKGTSIVIVNNDKGKKIMDIIQPQLKLYKEVDIEYVLTHGQPFNHSFKTNPAHDRYFQLINLGASLDKAYEYSTKRKFDVAIMGVWSGCNYGSIATYYALHELIKSFGLSILMIDKPLIKKNDPEQGMTHSRRFAKEHYEISRKYKLHELATLNNHVDTFVMGCDQVWNRGISRHFGMSYYFNFVDNSKKKISYAASFGHSKDFSNINDRTTISEYLSRFDDISVREADGVTICKEVYNVKATQVLDPVFVVDKSLFEELTYKSVANNRPNKDEKYVVTYILDPTKEKKDAINWVSSKLNLKVINLLDGVPWEFNKNAEKMANMGEIPKNVQVEDWLYYIKNSEFLVTDSCHGISFGIIFEKNFIGIANSRRGISRFESLLNTFHLTNRYVTNPSKIINNSNLLKPIDYVSINKILEAEKNRSKEWLKNALFKPKKIRTNCSYAVYDERLEEN